MPRTQSPARTTALPYDRLGPGARRHAPSAALATLAGWVGPAAAQSGGVLDPAGPIGTAQRTILLNSLAIMLAIVLPTIGATLVFAWWFRAGNAKAHRRPDWAYSGRVELVTWSIPVLVILFLGGITWIGSHELDPYRPIASDAKPVEVQVVSLDWKWLFIYPEQGVASVNQIVVPAGRPISFTLTSASVMNAFFVPRLGSMIYTMNGMTTRLHLLADREGEFPGLSSHFSGDGFASMHFTLRAVSEAGFDRWIEEAKSSPAALDRDGYQALAKQSRDVAPATFRSVDAHLFHAIVTQEVPPGPGPSAGSSDTEVSPRSGG